MFLSHLTNIFISFARCTEELRVKLVETKDGVGLQGFIDGVQCKLEVVKYENKQIIQNLKSQDMLELSENVVREMMTDEKACRGSFFRLRRDGDDSDDFEKTVYVNILPNKGEDKDVAQDPYLDDYVVLNTEEAEKILEAKQMSLEISRIEPVGDKTDDGHSGDDDKDEDTDDGKDTGKDKKDVDGKDEADGKGKGSKSGKGDKESTKSKGSSSKSTKAPEKAGKEVEGKSKGSQKSEKKSQKKDDEEEEGSKKGKKRKLSVAESEASPARKAKITRKEEETSDTGKKDD